MTRTGCDSKITVLTTDDGCGRGADGWPGRHDPHGGDSFLCDHAADSSADTGVIRNADGGVFAVEDTIQLQGGKIGHVGKVTKRHVPGRRCGDPEGQMRRTVRLPARTTAQPTCSRRRCVLFWASHVEQAGSYCDRETVCVLTSRISPP